tara:strand:- start:327 stop:575 length:249 start_codon:yes stop_codon:yes gene_type:complete
MNGLILDALYAKYHAQKSEAVAKLDVYLNNAVGIGEHPDIVDEIDKFIEKFADAQGKLDALKMMISHVGSKMPLPDKEILKG